MVDAIPSKGSIPSKRVVPRRQGPPTSSAESPSDEVLRDRPVMSPENQRFVLAHEYPRVVRIAQPPRRFDQRIEHRLEVEGRAADHLEHVGGGGLLLQRLRKVLSCFGEFAGPLVEFPLEIPRGTATARSRWRFAALDPRCLWAARLHFATDHRCAALARRPSTSLHAPQHI